MNQFKAFLVLFSLFFLVSLPTLAAENKDKAKKKDDPKAEVFESTHRIKINKKSIDYTATAGTLQLKNDKNEPTALFGYTAYIKSGKTSKKRPIVFAYNGGPGSSSVWLHMGILGPKRTLVKDAGFTDNAPYQTVDNEYSILDKADLVMIDPVGTGLSIPIGEGKGEDFWGVDQDIKSVSQFIVEYLNQNNRWSSPKYILGESYGGMRSGGVAYHLLTKHSVALNGVILVSPYMDAHAGNVGANIDLPHVLFFSTYAATAWYHDAIPNKEKDLKSFLKKADEFALGEYASALNKGSRLTHQERQSLLQKMQAFTGVSAEYWDKANLRLAESQFVKELLRDRKSTVGRIDSRYMGDSINLIGEHMSYDPFFPSIGPAIVASFNDYYRSELKVTTERSYKIMGSLWSKWDHSHQVPGGYKLPWANTGVDLAHTMIMNPNMRVLVQQGYFDLATPYGATNHFLEHLNISDKLRENIVLKMYEAGHMMYVHDQSMKMFKDDLAEFIR